MPRTNGRHSKEHIYYMSRTSGRQSKEHLCYLSGTCGRQSQEHICTCQGEVDDRVRNTTLTPLLLTFQNRPPAYQHRQMDNDKNSTQSTFLHDSKNSSTFKPEQRPELNWTCFSTRQPELTCFSIRHENSTQPAFQLGKLDNKNSPALRPRYLRNKNSPVLQPRYLHDNKNSPVLQPRYLHDKNSPVLQPRYLHDKNSPVHQPKCLHDNKNSPACEFRQQDADRNSLGLRLR